MTTIPATYEVGTDLRLAVSWGVDMAVTLNAEAVAVMHDYDTGEVVDVAYNFDSAESMALEGYVPVAVGAANAARYAERFVNLVALYNDCWGR
jgi:hypothetical protein